VEADSREAAERFSREFMQFITAGPQGTTGYAEGRPRVHPVFRYWPCLIARDAVTPHVEMLSTPASTTAVSPVLYRTSSIPQLTTNTQHPTPNILHPTSNIRHRSHLYDIACARSGDKGSNANIGVIVRDTDWWDFLQEWLTADRVAKYFSPLGVESVERFELPNLGALNFVLRGALRSLRTDAQGKALGQILLEMKLPKQLQ
jgi:hypothetical protein